MPELIAPACQSAKGIPTEASAASAEAASSVKTEAFAISYSDSVAPTGAASAVTELDSSLPGSRKRRTVGFSPLSLEAVIIRLSPWGVRTEHLRTVLPCSSKSREPSTCDGGPAIVIESELAETPFAEHEARINVDKSATATRPKTTLDLCFLSIVRVPVIWEAVQPTADAVDSFLEPTGDPQVNEQGHDGDGDGACPSTSSA